MNRENDHEPPRNSCHSRRLDLLVGTGRRRRGPQRPHAAAGLVAAPAVNGKLIDAASDCIKAGQARIAHCMASFAAGDTSLVACARIVDQMLSVCGTLQKLASAGSPRLADMAKVALVICDDCEAECRKHADHHATCKACAAECKAA